MPLSTSRRAPSRTAAHDGSPLTWGRERLRLLPAVPRPGKILHTSVNFSSHKAEVTKFKSEEWRSQNWGAFHYKHPTGFLQAPSSTVGTDAEVVIPRFTEQLDYEIEIATIIGRTAKNVTKETALDYVAGFCVFNDISARDIQSREHANKVILLGKSFDSSCPLGPWLTTRDEVPEPENLQMELRLNGEIRQNANTSEMIYGIRELVAWWSQITLEPGDVITSGSPAGVIAGREDAVWLKPGDRIEAKIERLGTLVSVIAAERSSANRSEAWRCTQRLAHSSTPGAAVARTIHWRPRASGPPNPIDEGVCREETFFVVACACVSCSSGWCRRRASPRASS